MTYVKKNQRRFLTLSLGLALFGMSPKAIAQANPSIAVAEALFQEARELSGQEKWAEACPKFAESQRLDPKLGTLLNLAHCHEQEGKTASAWAEYTSAATLAKRTGQKEREEFARQQIEVLEKKIAKVVIRMQEPPSGVQIFLDGNPIDIVVLGTPFPIDPGKHTFDVSAPNKKSHTVEVDVPSEHVLIPLTIPELATLPSTTEVPIAPVANPVKIKPEPTVRNDGQRGPARAFMIAGFGVGAVGLVVGAATGIATLSKAREILPDCEGNQCAMDRADDISTANTLANVSNIGFGVSAIFLAGGIAGILMLPKDESPRKAVSVTPYLGPNGLGVRGKFW